MHIELNQPFTADGAVDPFDVKQMKKALNRLGYYQPYEKVGVTGVPDGAVFVALKKFQQDYNLSVTGTAKPGDETIEKINQEAAKTPQGQYIWRTVDDDKVRSSHKELNGTIREWSDSPDPGEEFNCRCWAEPVNMASNLEQEVISPINDSHKKWDNNDFAYHFYFGDGVTKTLEEIGLLRAVIDHAKKTMFDNVLKQVANEARIVGQGKIAGLWDKSYNFGEVVFSLGGVGIKGEFAGTVKQEEKTLIVAVRAEYEFSDTFTDPINIRQNIIGSSALEDIPYNSSEPSWDRNNIMAGLSWVASDYGGTAYEITGRWITEITGSIPVDVVH